MNIFNVTKENFNEKVLKAEKTVLVDFYADWCSPCRMTANEIDALSKENDNFLIGKLNVDEQEDLAIQFNVNSIPTLMVFKNGKLTERSVGYMNKDEILKMINK